MIIRHRALRAAFALGVALATSHCVTVRRPAVAAAPEAQKPSWQALQKRVCEEARHVDAVDLLQAYAEAWEQQDPPPADGPQAGLSCALPMALQDYLGAANLAQQAQFSRAAAVLEKAQENPMPQAWRAAIALRQAWVALHQNDVATTRQYLDTARQADPQRVDVNLVYAQAMIADHAYSAAIDQLRAIMRQHPSIQDLGRAHALLQRAVREAEPPMSVQAQQMAQALMQAAEQAEAQARDDGHAAAGPEVRQELLRHAMAVADAAPHPRVHTLAGLIALKVGDVPRGLRLLDAALAANSLDPDPSRILAGFYLAQNSPWEAFHHLQVASVSDPFDIELQHVMVPVALRLGDVKTALASLQRLQVLQPDNAANARSLSDAQRVWTDMQAVGESKRVF